MLSVQSARGIEFEAQKELTGEKRMGTGGEVSPNSRVDGLGSVISSPSGVLPRFGEF